MWWVVTGVGVVTAALLWIYDRIVTAKMAASQPS
jgi:hypothetical protein